MNQTPGEKAALAVALNEEYRNKPVTIVDDAGGSVTSMKYVGYVAGNNQLYLYFLWAQRPAHIDVEDITVVDLAKDTLYIRNADCIKDGFASVQVFR